MINKETLQVTEILAPQTQLIRELVVAIKYLHAYVYITIYMAS